MSMPLLINEFVGKVFNVEHSPPWEFNTTRPIRGMAIPYFTTGLSFIFLRDINRLVLEYFNFKTVTPYFLLVTPRLLIAICSFVVDFSLKKICLNNNEKFKSRQLILGTSYVMLVYGTRTLSNSIELILFASLLYFVCESQTFSNELVRKQEYIKYRYEKSTTVAEKAKFHKLKLYLVSDNYRNCLIISTLSVFGVFNRPTFVAYALMPVFFWIYRGTGEKRVSVMQFHTRILFFFLCCMPAIIFNVIIDSFFYGYITWGEIGMLDVSINSLVVTPLNFIRYNLDSSNLEKHGLHPRCLHLLVNIPLLFNVLGVIALFTLGKFIYWGLCRKFQLLPSIKSIKMLMTMSFVGPLLILSIIPHQEPRFLIPIMFPLVYLHSEQIISENNTCVVKVPEASIQEKTTCFKKINKTNDLLKLWLVLNGFFFVFYGFIHQGGVYSAVDFLYKDIKFTPLNTEIHIVTSYVYSLPQSLILQKTSGRIFTDNNVKYSVKKRIFLYEEGSKDLSFIIKKLKIMAKTRDKLKPHYSKFKIYLLVSSTQIESSSQSVMEQGGSMRRVDSFWPHLSIEAPPDFTKYCLKWNFIFYDNCQVLSFREYVYKIKDMCELALYEVEFDIT
ncbi:hypothetical protein ABEB36_001250 [Hypothenemus hampei]|uniref:Mannosyltransferase n=1 Tax=Hypothenemus hampei TaxID=57062 RepID=A0ABD1FDZ9_HYPHA